jgi:hypothetical protein
MDACDRFGVDIDELLEDSASQPAPGYVQDARAGS